MGYRQELKASDKTTALDLIYCTFKLRLGINTDNISLANVKTLFFYQCAYLLVHLGHVVPLSGLSS